MKQLLTILFVLIWSGLMAQELTADSPAVEPTLLEQIWLWTVRGFWAVLAWLGVRFSQNANVIVPKIVEALTVFLKTWNHWRGSGVVIDTGMQVVSEMGFELAKKLDDGILTDDEKKALIAEIKNRSVGKLKNLYGFVKADLEEWAQEQAAVFVGKFLYRNSAGSGSKKLSM